MNEGIQKSIGPCREKYWEEMDAEQKIEALRDALSHTCRLVQRQENLINKLLEHRHASDGGLMSPLHGAENHALGYMGGSYTADGGIPFRLRTARERG